MNNKKQDEETLTFLTRFDANGLIPCITTSAKTGKVLMLAWMNEQAIRKSIETGQAHYWSRSRQKLWHKGESSGNTQKIIHMRTDCDQDCLWISVEMNPDASCHTGRESCFYREIDLQADANSGQMKFIDVNRIFNPEDVYS
ncbi:MAG TPA: phosphoribosyl-AMP cyclohydrolase [Alphaproteobacteria bacterium]|nr:phosphoribosyl-AMP cyclohydrolase [Alphaproteobacteria bacterium]